MSTPNAVSFPFKAACVTLLVVQNSALALTMRYSRAVLKEQYLTSTTIVLNEVVKLSFALLMMLIGFRLQKSIPLAQLPRHLISIIFCREGLLMTIPGLLYFCMNQLAFVGLENLDASSYSLVSQLKILTTAFFARVMLKKQLGIYQWRALLLLIIGVVLVQQQPEKITVTVSSPSAISTSALPPLVNGPQPAATETFPAVALTPQQLGEAPPARGRQLLEIDTELERAERAFKATIPSTTFTTPPLTNLPSRPPPPSPAPTDGFFASSSSPSTSTSSSTTSVFTRWKGFIATTGAAILSGLAGCYMEKMMKGGTLSVWDRNIQLAVYGIVLGLLQIIFTSSAADRAYAAKYGWLGGYSFVAWVVVFLNSLGGILVSLILAYLDNIIRGFATSIAIFITALFSYAVFHDIQITITFCCGVLAVLVSVFNYNDPMVVAPNTSTTTSSSPTTNLTSPLLGSTSASTRSPHGHEVELSHVKVHRFSPTSETSSFLGSPTSKQSTE